MRANYQRAKYYGWIPAGLLVTTLLISADAMGGQRSSYAAAICHPHKATDFHLGPELQADGSPTSDAYQEDPGAKVENDTAHPPVVGIRVPEVLSCPLGNTQPGSPHYITSVAVYGKTGVNRNDGTGGGTYTCYVVSTWVNDQTGEVEILEEAADYKGAFVDSAGMPVGEVVVKLNIPVNSTANWGVYTLMCRLPPADADIWSYTVERAD